MKVKKFIKYRAWRELFFFLFCFVLFLPEPEHSYSQITRKRADHLEKIYKERQKFKDEYSDLDKNRKVKIETDDFVSTTLEKSRQYYLQALILIKKGDTISAARYFQQAIDNLNKLVSYPNIEYNHEFNDLSQSIVEDYENYITNIDNLDENAPLFIVRDKLFQEIEKIPATPAPAVQKPFNSTFSSQKYPNRHTKPDSLVIPLIDHDLVNRSITFLTKNKRGQHFVRQCMERSGKWFPMMKRIAEAEGMPEEIVYLSMIESGLNPNAVSRASAVGLWQFMRATGQDYNLNKNESFWIDERRDPEKSTYAAMRHLRDLYNEFGDWHLALAAYNCGTGCIRRSIRKSKLEKPSYWDILKFLPNETAIYVPNFIATAKIMMNPELYGFDEKEISYQSEYKYDIFEIKEPTNLSAIAKAAGISLEELKELNPELLQNVTPPDRKVYFIKIPYNTYQTFAKNFEALPYEEKQPFIFHTVSQNESLTDIARKYNVSVDNLIAVNNLSGYKAKLKKGDSLRIPIGSEPFDSDNIVRTPTKTDTLKADVVQNPNVESSNVGQIITHIVKPGESIYSISKLYGIRPADLRNMNNLPIDLDNIQVGQKLIVARNNISNTANANNVSQNSSPQKKTIKHKVRKGETLAKIADKYSTTIDNIISLNRLKKSSIKVGQVLKIEQSAAISQATSVQQTQQTNQPQQKVLIHKVEKGETLASISHKYGVTEEQLREWNKNDIKGDIIIAGSRLKVQQSNNNETGKSSKNNISNNKKTPVYHTVRSGDTLERIAGKYNVSVDELKNLNKGVKETRLQIGQKIRVK
ncbi:MAG TPA: LysM peptidoglycan-binding domain-containing protein [Candidatus Kapabacteria bacterium]|nr:LysM peptidoglycan-binding domain-containing protein [Candidatus Kapabacteria bacterium]